MRLKRLGAVAAACAFVGLSLAAPSGRAASGVENSCVPSVREPDGSAVRICFSLYRPDGADAAHPVPVVVQGHAWGNGRGSGISVQKWLKAGFGVMTFDQRGWGQSTGKVHWQHPDFEARDVEALLDVVATKDWVAREANDSSDPRVGGFGASYGGGFQLATAFSEVMRRGRTRFDVLAPQVTWWDWQESLAPGGVPRTAWLKLLQASGAAAMTEQSHRGFAYMDVTGAWPADDAAVAAGADLRPVFEGTGPKWHVANGRRLDIPVLLGQGMNDNLFNLNQGFRIFDRALTPEARARSLFVGYNGGAHALPTALSAGASVVGDPCSRQLAGGSYEDLAIRFFREVLKGEKTGLSGQGAYHLASTRNRCITVDAHAPVTSRSLGNIIATSGSGAPVQVKVADGPVRLVGTPLMDTNVTTFVGDSRAFLGLSMGTSPSDAKLISNDVSPLREWLVTSRRQRVVELPAVAVEVPAGQSLFLTISPASDTFFASGSRSPGAMLFDGTVVHLPLR